MKFDWDKFYKSYDDALRPCKVYLPIFIIHGLKQIDYHVLYVCMLSDN